MSRFTFILLLVGLFFFGSCKKSEQEAPPPAEEPQEQVDTTSVDTSGMQSMDMEMEQEAGDN